MRLLIAAAAAFFVSFAQAETPIPKPKPECETIENFMRLAQTYEVGEHLDFPGYKFVHVPEDKSIVVLEMQADCIIDGLGVVVFPPSSLPLIEKIFGSQS